MIYTQWQQCPRCKVMKALDKNNESSHSCDENIVRRVEALIEPIIDVELATFEMDLKEFWEHPKTKFDIYLALKKII